MYLVDRYSQVGHTKYSKHDDQKQACHLGVSYENNSRIVQQNQHKKIKLQESDQY